MRSFFVVALAALSSAQRITRPNANPNPVNNAVNNFNKGPAAPLVTLTATETVYVTSCPPVTTVCGKTTKVSTTSTKAAATTTTSGKAPPTTTTTTTVKPTTTLSTTTKPATTTTTTKTTTVAPTPTPSCFRIQARSSDRSINNSYFDSPVIPETLVSLTKINAISGIYTLDSSSQLRNARNGAVASRQLLPRTSYGPVWISALGKRRADDKVTCSAVKGTLKCSAAGGSQLYSRGNNLYIAKDANVPRDFRGVELLVWADKCPVGMPKM